MVEKPRRKPPTMAEKIAALHIENQALKGDPIADWETLKAMTAEQLCSLFEWQHTTYNVWIEDRARQNHPTVLTPMYVKAHQEVTARKDLPTIAKVKRVSAAQAEFKRAMDAKIGKIESETFYVSQLRKKPKQKIKSRGFQGSRRFDGSIKWKHNKGK